jgi:hypothetical protein
VKKHCFGRFLSKFCYGNDEIMLEYMKLDRDKIEMKLDRDRDEIGTQKRKKQVLF